jgi:hypothetical protein
MKIKGKLIHYGVREDEISEEIENELSIEELAKQLNKDEVLKLFWIKIFNK